MNRGVVGAFVLLALGTAAYGQMPSEQQIAAVLTLLPEDARADATLLVPSDSGFAVHKTGKNAFVCEMDRRGDDQFSIACYHRSLQQLRTIEQELAAQGVRGQTFRNRLCARVAELDLSIPDGALELSGSAKVARGAELPDSMAVYHLLYFPHATEATIGVPDEEHLEGAPWLHLAGTCQAHVMWQVTHYFDREPYR